MSLCLERYQAVLSAGVMTATQPSLTDFPLRRSKRIVSAVGRKSRWYAPPPYAAYGERAISEPDPSSRRSAHAILRLTWALDPN
jgi:hypothetical protein